MAKKIVLALFGKSASGKDSLQSALTQKFANCHPIISCTTRPMREGEHDGKDYHFLSIVEFTKYVLEGKMLEATCFRDWFYGTLEQDLLDNCLNVGVFNLEGVRTLLSNPDLIVYTVFVNASDKVRLIRALNREENPDCAEICRRFEADEKDFKDMSDIRIHYTFDNNSSDSEVLTKELAQFCEWIDDIITGLLPAQF